jgi:hypothetical protein
VTPVSMSTICPIIKDGACLVKDINIHSITASSILENDLLFNLVERMAYDKFDKYRTKVKVQKIQTHLFHQIVRQFGEIIVGFWPQA